MSAPNDMIVQLTVGELQKMMREAVDFALARHASEQQPEVLNTQQVADLLGRHAKTVPALIERGLPAHYISDREPRFKRVEVLAWLDSLPTRGGKAAD